MITAKEASELTRISKELKEFSRPKSEYVDELMSKLNTQLETQVTAAATKCRSYCYLAVQDLYDCEGDLELVIDHLTDARFRVTQCDLANGKALKVDWEAYYK